MHTPAAGGTAGGPAADGTRGRRALRKVFLRMADRVVCRVFDARLSTVQLLGGLSDALHALETASAEPVLGVSVNTGLLKMPVYKAVYFSNICGVVSHRPSEHLVRAAVRPYLSKQMNTFGPSMELYSAACNLVVYQNKSSTLFRGGRDTAAIHTTIQHALDETYIMHITMHMLVASGNVGHAVSMQSPHIARRLCADPRWTARLEARLENNSCVQVKLSGFDVAWMHSMIPHEVCTVRSLLLIICISGNVNMFLTPDSPVAFAVGVEHTIRPFYEFFLDYLVQEL
jgi:hypothetical protein